MLSLQKSSWNKCVSHSVSPGSSVHEILQARILEWAAIPHKAENIYLSINLQEKSADLCSRALVHNSHAYTKHPRLGLEFEWTPRVGDGQGGLACRSPWGCKESDTTKQLNWLVVLHIFRNWSFVERIINISVIVFWLYGFFAGEQCKMPFFFLFTKSNLSIFSFMILALGTIKKIFPNSRLSKTLLQVSLVVLLLHLKNLNLWSFKIFPGVRSEVWNQLVFS